MQGSTTVKLFDPADFDSLPSCLLTLSFVSTKDTPWAEKGFETGFEQFILKDYTPYVPKDGRVELSENDRFAVIKAGNIAYTFDKPYGRISSITCGGKELLIRRHGSEKGISAAAKGTFQSTGAYDRT